MYSDFKGKNLIKGRYSLSLLQNFQKKTNMYELLKKKV